MINEVDLGALRGVVDDCLQRQETAERDFILWAGLPKRYVVPITRNIHCGYDEFVFRLGCASAVFDSVYVLNRLLSDGLWQMDIVISTDDLEFARAHVNDDAWRIMDMNKGGNLIRISD